MKLGGRQPQRLPGKLIHKEHYKVPEDSVPEHHKVERNSIPVDVSLLVPVENSCSAYEYC